MSKPLFERALRFIWVALLVNTAFAQAPQITSFSPARFSLNNATSVSVSVTFDQAMDAGTLESPNFLIYGQRTGFHSGIYGYDGSSQVATFSPDSPFEAGERVTVILTDGIQNSTGTPLANSFQWSFFIATTAGQAKFDLDSTYVTGDGPHFVGLGDLTGDGFQDVAVPHSKDAAFRTWPNQGDGTLGGSSNFGVGNSPRSLTIADLDGDNDLDIAVANQNDNSISIALNNGSGNFTVQGGTIAVGTQPVFLAHGDLDGDGDLDLVAVNTVDNDISVLLNSGNATFPSRTDFAVQTAPQAAFIDDFNNDGFMDVTVTNSSSSTVTLLLNDGTGGFSVSDQAATANGPRTIMGHDFDLDGLLDVATVNRNGNSASILINRGNGTFAASVDFAVGTDPFGLAVGDIDGDLDADLVVSNRLSNNVSVLTNDGAGFFVTDSTYGTDLEPRSIGLADMNGDGILDMVAAAWDADRLHLFFNRAIPVLNDPPNAPSLNTPADAAFINQVLTPIVLNWDVPVDVDGDSLHFLVEVSATANFASTVVSADSRLDVTGFTPAPKVAQSVSDVSYAVSTSLADGVYFWRVSAHDGITFGSASTVRKFTVDSTDPNIDSVSLTNPGPAFAPDWYNQNSESTVDFVVQYDEARPERATFGLGALGGTQQITGLSNGTDQTTQVQININGAADGSYPLVVTIVDSAGNSDATNSNISLDGSPPTGTAASSPATSQTLAFTVSWGGTGSDGSGSGLSGAYDVQLQVDGGSWAPWLTNFQGTSSSFSGEQGRTYAFEAAAHDNVGNIELFSDVAETVTEVDTVTDNVAPGTPLNLTANSSNPSPWQSNPLFSVMWQNPADATGIDRAFYKLGAAPASNADTTGSVAGTTALIVQATAENGQSFYVWLRDGAGNLDFNNNAAVQLRYDATAPTGTLASSPPVSGTETFAVSWGSSGSDGAGSGLSGIYDVKVQVNGGTFSDWLTNFTGTSANYPGEHGNTYGFEVAAHDVAGNVEAFLLTAESTTQVDTTANDVTPPGPPPSLLANGANPSAWQNSANFLVSWQEPVDASGIEAALYKLGTAPTANFDTTGSVRSATSAAITASEADGQDLHLWFQDQKGNVDFRNSAQVRLRYDDAAPEIFEMDFQNIDFLPNWYRQAGSDIVQVILEYTERHASQVNLTSVDLDTTIAVANVVSGKDVPVAFNLRVGDKPDGVYTVNFAVADSAGSSDTDSTEFRLDSTPPTGTTASSPATSQTATFTVSWGGTGSDGTGSGLSGIYDVRFRENGGAWQDWLTDFSGTSSQFTGEEGSTYDFEVAGHDNLGNVEAFLQTAESSTEIAEDNSFINIQHTQPFIVDEGQDATIEIEVQSTNPITEAKLFYRRSTVLDFSELVMPNAGGITFTAVLPAADIGTVGINYFFRVSDGNSSTFSPVDWQTLPFHLAVRIMGGDGTTGFVRTQPQPNGVDALAFRMFSVPLNLSSGDPVDVLADDLGQYDPTKWRLFQFNSATNVYEEFPNVSGFNPSRAFWLIIRQGNLRIDSGVGSTVPTNEPFEITLNQGWTDIGMPFVYSVNSANIQIVAGDPISVIGPYTYTGQGWITPESVTSLNPWEGYSFFSEQAGARISIAPTPTPGSSSKRVALISTTEPEWSIRIAADNGTLSDRSSSLGVASDATLERDQHDFLEPPYISDFVSVRFPHQDWQRLPGNYKTDFRPSFSDGEIWSFEIATSMEGLPVTLRFDELQALPSQFEALLVDRTTLRQIDLRDFSEYRFTPRQDKLKRKFELVVGTAGYVQNSDFLQQLVPEVPSLLPNYPNPFNAGTTINYHVADQGPVSVVIMNVLGQQIASLVDEVQDAGIYQIQWNGRDDRQVEVGTGVYFVRLRTGRFYQTRKILLVR